MFQRTLLILSIMAALFVTACQPVAPAAPEPAILTLASHDSFAVSEDVVAAFEEQHGVKLQFLTLGDAGEALNKLILSADAPLADVFFGVDNTFLSRALNADVFAPYASPLLSQIPDELKLDASNRLLPVDYGFVNLNADAAWFEAAGIPLPETLDDLAKPEYAGLLVAPNPATSSPGLAFLLTTIARFGEGATSTTGRRCAATTYLSPAVGASLLRAFAVGSGGGRPSARRELQHEPARTSYLRRRTHRGASVTFTPGDASAVEFIGISRTARGSCAPWSTSCRHGFPRRYPTADVRLPCQCKRRAAGAFRPVRPGARRPRCAAA